MASPIEDYALIGDCQGAALVGRTGSIDWLCLPRFDSDACFASLLGDEDNGFWKIAPSSPIEHVERRYRGDSLTLETDFTTREGKVRLIDFMPIADRTPDLVRIVQGLEGEVPMRSEFVLRCNYGLSVPWVQRTPSGIEAVAGPDRFRLTTPVALHGKNFRTHAHFSVAKGQQVPFVLGWCPSNHTPHEPTDPLAALATNDAFWKRWAERGDISGPYAQAIKRSLITLKALTYAPTGGMVAAPTTSLPEQLGSVRNWDYRYCWIRDATFTLYALLNSGYHDEARAFRRWILRAAAGMPSQLQILYGIGGERRLVESELGWLKGYEGSRPVRVGNAASTQLQLDVYGELLDSWYLTHEAGLAPSNDAWRFHQTICRHLTSEWRKPDQGIWEVRGEPRHFTHSKVMCWVAFDRSVKAIERWGLPGPLEEWRAVREEIHEQVCREAWDEELRSFVQYPGSKTLDASLLQLVLVGFLPPEDGRIKGTVAAIEKHLMKGGLVQRYVTHPELDGLPNGEGTFLACSFWLADSLVLLGRVNDARALFERLAGLANDVGLLAEEYDPQRKRMLGNFPQALSHVALVNTAHNLSRAEGPAHHRRTCGHRAKIPAKHED